MAAFGSLFALTYDEANQHRALYLYMPPLHVHNSIHDIDKTQWQQLRTNRYPFLDYDFLAALEDSGCINNAQQHTSGWTPAYISYREDNRYQLIVPAYIKDHSAGEFIFDGAWADAYERHGFAYYPKLVHAIPFSPVQGPRFLAHPSIDDPQALVYEALTALCQQHQLSGWHSLFPDTPVAASLQTLSMSSQAPMVRSNPQFHWFNQGDIDFSDYLARFSSRKRKGVLKERRQLHEQGIHVVRKLGGDITPDDLEFFMRCYQSTYDKKGSFAYLNADFFKRVHAHMAEQIMLVMAYQENTPIACAWHLFDEHTLYGRYWGCTENIPALHFECCYYQGIEFCLQHTLARFDPGAQGEHKIPRGFEPIMCHSVHWLAQPDFHRGITDFVHQEHPYVVEYCQEMQQKLPFKQPI